MLKYPAVDVLSARLGLGEAVNAGSTGGRAVVVEIKGKCKGSADAWNRVGRVLISLGLGAPPAERTRAEKLGFAETSSTGSKLDVGAWVGCFDRATVGRRLIGTGKAEDGCC